MEWTRTLDEALKWDFDIVIPGHGPLARRADLMKARSDVEAIRNRIRAMIREGKTADDVARMLITNFGWNPNGAGIRGVTALMAELAR